MTVIYEGRSSDKYTNDENENISLCLLNLKGVETSFTESLILV